MKKNDAETLGHFFLSLPSDKISASLIHADKAHESIRFVSALIRRRKKRSAIVVMGS